MQCRREESKGESEKLSPWSEGIGEADSLPSVAVPQKSKISKIKCSGRFLKFTIDSIVAAESSGNFTSLYSAGKSCDFLRDSTQSWSMGCISLAQGYPIPAHISRSSSTCLVSRIFRAPSFYAFVYSDSEPALLWHVSLTYSQYIALNRL